MNKIAVCCTAAMLTACASTPTVDSIVSEGGEEDQVLVKRANGNYSIFTNGEMGKYPFKVANGNPNNY